MPSKVWEASGHVTSFYDPKIDCKSCKTRLRADNFITEASNGEVSGDTLSYDEMDKYIEENNVKCPVCVKTHHIISDAWTLGQVAEQIKEELYKIIK